MHLISHSCGALTGKRKSSSSVHVVFLQHLAWPPSLFAQTDLVALAESLAMGLDTGATMGEVLVAETFDASATAVIPTAVEPTEHTAAILTGYSGAPEVRSVFPRLRTDADC